MTDFFQGFLNGLQETSQLEYLAVFSSLVYVVLAAKNNIWCWAASIVSVTCYLWICYTSKLYFETFLQLYYIATTVYGYLLWHKQKNKPVLPLSFLPLKLHIALISGGIIATISFAWLAEQYSNAALPLIDAFTTIFALIATVMVAKRIVENWLYWVIIDAVSIFLYSSRGLHLSAVLFLLYTIIAVIGFLNWQKIFKSQAT